VFPFCFASGSHASGGSKAHGATSAVIGVSVKAAAQASGVSAHIAGMMGGAAGGAAGAAAATAMEVLRETYDGKEKCECEK
jgi:hypothetical protein